MKHHPFIVVDAGGTSTTYATIHYDENQNVDIQYINGQGIHPFIDDQASINQKISDELIPNIDTYNNYDIYYYGTGCSNLTNIQKVKTGLDQVNPRNIKIEHDMYGAALAVSLGKPFIAGILGTGANACAFDGNSIIQTSPSLGYVLGDEGSGAHIGKLFLTEYLYHQTPDDIKEKFQHSFQLSDSELIRTLYSHQSPNTWLASIAKFVSNNASENYCKDLIYKSFTAYILNHILKFPQVSDFPFGVVGSVAYHNQEILESVCYNFGIRLDKVIQNPINELVSYHLQNN